MFGKKEENGTVAGGVEAEKQRRKEKNREKREKDKEKIEKKKEKEKEKREKDKREREEKDREKKEKREREKQERERERRSAAPLGSPAESSTSVSHSFVWRLFHTLTHILFIFLLLLTIGSLIYGTSALFSNSATEVATLLQHGMAEANYQEVAIAMVGLVIFLFILALTVLACVMLIPALWVSLLEVIVCPWSIASDYFLP